MPIMTKPLWSESMHSPHAELFLKDEALRRGLELFFFAQRDLNDAPDPLLIAAGLGRAHHRALYFIGRAGKINVSGLLDLLKITKQSLSRILDDLRAEDYVMRKISPDDRRQRILALTPKGQALEAQLFEAQRNRMKAAYKAAGTEAVAGFWSVLAHLIDADERQAIKQHLKSL